MTKPAASPLKRMVDTTPTDLWNDSCAAEELRYAIAHGAVGATSNPSIVLEVLRAEMPRWTPLIDQLIAELPTASETELTWRLIERVATQAAELLLPVFEQHGGKKGRLSIQTDPTRYRDAAAITAQAVRFDRLAPNMQVKIPATEAGLQAIEQATAQGVSINATVCFTVAQSIAVAEAVERGLEQRRRAGQSVEQITPVCTLMVGRIDDWLKVVAERDLIAATPGDLDWAGIACIKRAAAIYRDRGFSSRLLAAAYRHHLHWSELVGGDLILTITHRWQRLFNSSSIPVEPRFDRPVDPAILDRLQRLFADFRRAYDPGGLPVDAFDRFGATRLTLRTFISSYHDLIGVVRDRMLPDPALARATGAHDEEEE